MTAQTAFRAALLDTARAAPQGVQNPDGSPATKRFNVYRNNVAVSLTQALETAFPVVRKLVGDDFFHAMAGVYLRAHPPASPLMMFYGSDMPDFLAGFAPARAVPYLPDVARLELALRHSYHAEDATALDPDALAQIPPDDLPHITFGFAPAVHLIVSRYPIVSIWRANTHGSGTTTTPAAEAALVTRAAFDPVIDALAPEQAAVTTALMSGTPLGKALQQGGAMFDLGPLLAVLLQRGALHSLQP